MKVWNGMHLAKTVSAYVEAGATVVIVAALLWTILLAPARLHWVTYLAGVLTAAALAMVMRASRAEWIVRRRSAQLFAMRAKLAHQVQLRTRGDDALAAVRKAAYHVDLSLPAMILYVDGERIVRFHNAAFREWLGIRGDQIDDHSLDEVLGAAAYADIVGHIVEALAGRRTVTETSHRMPDGESFTLAVQYLPHFGEKGRVLGAFALLTDITEPRQLRANMPDFQREASDSRMLYVNAIAEELTGWKNVADRLRAALDGDEFCLYCQAIVPAKPLAAAMPFYEILIRLNEEERNLMPPGVFLQLAEEHGLLPDLDRWVVRHLLDWACADPSPRNATYSINVSGPTLSDGGFVAFVAEELRGRNLRGLTLCFEFTEAEAMARPHDAARLVRRLKREGCRTALSGFGRSLGSFDLLRQSPVDYLKIDSGIVFGMLRGSIGLAKVKAINNVAHAAGMATIAECVENEETLAALRELGVDFAQGFEIAQPMLLTGLRPEVRRIPKEVQVVHAEPG